MVDFSIFLLICTVVCLVYVKGGLLDDLFNLTLRECGTRSELPLKNIHILRIPKASSSALSVVARRAVGCVPVGPCCKYPGDPPGSCPHKDLFSCQKERRVIGCTNHYPMHGALEDANLTSISIMREPIARSISAFFYPGSHHNSNCTHRTDACFLEYLQNPRWGNVVVKMLTGQYAYSTLPTCRFKSECAHSLELARENLRRVLVMGITEMWELSLMLLHCKLRHVTPSIDEFRLSSQRNHGNSSVSRFNARSDYSEFFHHAVTKFRVQLTAQNQLDIELYRTVLENVYSDLHALQLWRHPCVQEYWSSKMAS